MRPTGQAMCGNALQALDNPTAGLCLPLCQPQDPLIGQHDVACHINHHITQLWSSHREEKDVKSQGELLNRHNIKT